MSHYAVAVIHKENQKVEELLAPYDENIEVEQYMIYTEKEAIDYVRKNYPDMKDASDKECWTYLAEGHLTDYDRNILSTYNPKSKWDWWTIGGRYSGLLMDKYGNKVDSGKFKDLVFELDKDQYKQFLRWWEVVIEDVPLKEGENKNRFFSIWSKEYYLDRYGDASTYAKCMASFKTYAVVTPDGEWHAPGDMGWFACSSESHEEWQDWVDNYYDRFIAGADPEWILTIVDCHI